jgi:hypothetical protein
MRIPANEKKKIGGLRFFFETLENATRTCMKIPAQKLLVIRGPFTEVKHMVYVGSKQIFGQTKIF